MEERKKRETDLASVIRSYGLNNEFPSDVMRQTDAIGDTVIYAADGNRRDLRRLKMVTIDGEDAKDLDDAVSLEMLPGGNYRLGVHIADVSYYVPENSPLDREAQKRGTSVYLVDRVIPMLPAKLSNGICSLNPGVDRLAFTVMMDIDLSGRVVRHEIFESIICINRRMTYTDVYKILVENDEELCKEYHLFVEDFKIMEKLACILRSMRMARGSIDFDFDEAKIILDETGRPVEIKRYEITIANKIIEEFMLVCNETVAGYFHGLNVPFIYRIHEEPDREKMKEFFEFAGNLGYHLKARGGRVHPRVLQELLERVKGTREEMKVGTVMLRSLQKARYSNRNCGHFGLAAGYYCHFTSPIRRYPDLMIHRIMKEHLKYGISRDRERVLNKKLPDMARLCSEKERTAVEAERETEDIKKVEYMRGFIGETFEAVISNITSFGMFVELGNTVEGMVSMSSMEDDYYKYNWKKFCLVGERTGKTYHVGDRINVMLTRADIESRQIDFSIVLSSTDNESRDGKKSGKKQYRRKNGRKPERGKNGRKQV